MRGALALVVVVVVVVVVTGGAGCATASVYSIEGDSSRVASVDRRFNAVPIELDFRAKTGENVALGAGFREEATARLGEMLPAAADAPAGPPTKMTIQTIGDSTRTVEVTLVTPIDGKDVVTSRASPDLAAGPWPDVALVGLVVVGAGALAALTSVYFGVLGGQLVIGAGVGAALFVVAGVAGVVVWRYALAQEATQVSQHGSQFMGEMLRDHALNIRKALATPAEAAPATSADPSREWFVAVGEEQRGPLSVAEVRALLAAGTITMDTLVWKKGMEWTPLHDVKALKPPPTPPPLPSSGPPPLPKSTTPPPLPH